MDRFGQLGILCRTLLVVYLFSFLVNRQHLHYHQLNNLLGPYISDHHAYKLPQLFNRLLLDLPQLVFVVGERPLQGVHDLLAHLQFLHEGREDRGGQVHH